MTPNPAAWLSAAGSFPSRIAGQTGLPTYTTSYGYDLLNNLLSVSQTDPTSSVTLSRSFAYDSLKRLVRATNPENGQISYQYDASGNLSSRADASRTVSYGAYDGLNRAASKSYSDGITPAVSYTYGDQSYPACQAVGVGTCGRLTTVTATPPSGTTIVNSYSAFDPVGRVKTSSQQFGAALPYTFTYNYDLSGALSSVTYPSGRTVTNAFDAAGRIAGVTGTLSAASTPYASSVAYAPQVRHRQPESVQWHRRGRRV